MIIEASSSETKKKKNLVQQKSKEEFRSLKKYLAEESYEEVDSKGNKVENGEKEILLNESDIAELWNHNREKQVEHKAHQQFSPKYSSGNKSSIHRVQNKSGKNSKTTNAIIKPVRVAVIPDETLNAMRKESQKGTISNGYSGVEDAVGSFRQPVHGLRSSSQNTNLL